MYESRSLILPDTKEELVRAVARLEDVPEEEKDWHPGSNQQVLDLVHPSLYCIRLDKTLFRKDPFHSDVVKRLTWKKYTALRADLSSDSLDGWPGPHQWLPTDFVVSGAGVVTPQGYINNLHPVRHSAAYRPLTSILARFVPLFEKVLTDSLNYEPSYAVEVDAYRWYEHVWQLEPSWTARSSDELYEQQRAEWDRKHRWPAIPDPAPFQPPPPREPYSLRGRTIQVIVKLANIVLTPDRPQYPGGTWHVEGMVNERIVATGLYYYACENITESRLAFRTRVGNGDGLGRDFPYEQNDDKGCRVAYGLAEHRALNQPLGHVVAAEDKCVAFPNMFQHRVEPFELADPTKPGHRKILCFFLVDPEARVLSTRDVPPQQVEWALDELARAPAMQKLPVELFDMIASYVRDAGFWSRQEAEEQRAELMKERSSTADYLKESVYEMDFNLCEH